MELESVRPGEEGVGGEELRFRASALPLRLRIDQDVLLFMQTFFQEQPSEDPCRTPEMETLPAATHTQTSTETLPPTLFVPLVLKTCDIIPRMNHSFYYLLSTSAAREEEKY